MLVSHPVVGNSAWAPLKHATLTVPAFSQLQLSTVHISTALTNATLAKRHTFVFPIHTARRKYFTLSYVAGSC